MELKYGNRPAWGDCASDRTGRAVAFEGFGQTEAEAANRFAT